MGAVDWEAGERILVTPSGVSPLEAEVAEIASIIGTRIQLSSPLNYSHYGAPEVPLLAGRQVIEDSYDLFSVLKADIGSFQLKLLINKTMADYLNIFAVHDH